MNKMSPFLCIALVLALVFSVAAQSSPANKTTKQQALTVDGVIAMVQAGLSDDVIVARLRKEEKPFDLSPDDMIRLKKAKVSDTIVEVMLDPKAEPKTPAAAAPPVANVSMSGASAITGIQPSGATPIAGNAPAGDLNDPMVPHDSGIYLFTKDRAGKPQMIVLERASIQGAKSGGFFTSAVTYGAVKAKTKAEIPGPHATIRAAELSPVFYFYFDDKQAGLGKSYFGMNSVSNPNQFVLLKLDVKKSHRETIIGKYSAWGSSSGTDSGASMPFKAERVRTGLYKVSVDPLPQGEYCFYASSGGTTAAGPMAMTTVNGTDIFDFGVDTE
jgi:hypothetical protein